METTTMPVRLNLKEWRTLKGWSQAELAKRAGVRQPTISDMETGIAKSVSFDVLDRLAGALGVHPTQLFVDRPPVKRDRR